jgi:hypothetical protein
MRNQTGIFTDLDPSSKLLQPDVVVRAADIANRRIIVTSDMYDGSVVRKVLYETTAGVKYYLELVPYLHPVGAGSLEIATVAYSATGVATITPTKDNYGLLETGALCTSGSKAREFAGFLFADYFTHATDNADQQENFRCLTIEEGDFLWLIRGGVWYVYTGDAVTSGEMLIASSATDGKLMDAVDFDPTSVASINSTLFKNMTGDASPRYGEAVARALETVGGASTIKVEIVLPKRRYR